ncbi:MAG: hypothetical protein R3F55_09755 [Alphaproteobacteria bacterium]
MALLAAQRTRALAVGLGLTAFATADAIGQDRSLTGEGPVLAQQCVSCHADAAVGRRIPPLWGLDQSRILSALEAFRDGNRDNPAMMSVARTLTTQQMLDIARYFAGQPVGGN